MKASHQTHRAAIYARQSVAEDVGITQQVDECRAEIKRRGWLEIDAFIDNDTSGSKKRNAKTDWAKMLASFDRGEFEILIVTETSRLTRRLSDVLDVTAPQRNLRIIVKREGIDTAVDDYLLKQLVLLAEREVKLKTQRAKVYADGRRAKGHPTAGRTPHGYAWIPAKDRDEAGTRYRINEREANDVKRIYEEFLNGASLGQIARDLTNDNRLTRSDAKWYSSTVRKVLMNPQYAALLQPAQETGKFNMSSIDLDACVPGAWEEIITEAELRATRAMLVGVKPNHRSTSRKWLLSGLAVCDVCGVPVRSARGETKPTARVSDGESAPRQRYHAYRCPEKGHFMRKGDAIDELVAELCIRRLSRDDAIDLLTPAEDGINIAALNAQLIELEGREATLALLVAGGSLKETAAKTALDQLHAEQRTINEQITQAVRRDPLAEAVGREDVRAWWKDLTLARKRILVEALMQVRIKPVGYGRKINTVEQVAESVEIIWKG